MISLSGKTVIVTGSSRGIGKAIALRCAKDGANVVIAAKTIDNEGKLKGTIHEAAEEIERAGGKALAVQVDVRDLDQIHALVQKTVEKFRGIDAVVNNAGAIALRPVEGCPPKRYDLMMAINSRAPFLLSQACIPHLKKSDNGHILNLSPPIDLDPRWFAVSTAYTMSKYGMSLLTIGLAEELRDSGVAVNSLWPRKIIATAAVNMLGGEDMMNAGRTPEIMADAAYMVLTTASRKMTGQHLVDEDFLRTHGVTDFDRYSHKKGAELMDDFYITSEKA